MASKNNNNEDHIGSDTPDNMMAASIKKLIVVQTIIVAMFAVSVISSETNELKFVQRCGKHISLIAPHVMMLVNQVSRLECAQKCMSLIECLSFNFRIEGGICELKNTTADDNCLSTQNEENVQYFEMVSK